MPEDTECPTCGRDDFKNTRGMRQHHAKEHGESITVTVECSWCGSDIEKSPHRAELTTHHFCRNEKKCEGHWKSENQSAEESNLWNGGTTTVECSWCGESLERTSYQIESYNHFFCENTTCQANWQSRNWRGENAPAWKGGAGRDYGPMWTEELREYIREKQNRQCAACGVVDTFLPKNLDVHHINPDRWLNDWKINQVWNLVALCPTCHRRWEGKREAKQRMEFGKHAMRAGWPDDDEPFVGFDKEAAEASGWLVAD